MKFENLEMSDNDSIDAYAAKLSGIASKSATLGEVMLEHKLVKKFLISLPRHFVHIVAALEQVLEVKTTGFEDVVGRLKAYEERVKEEDKANDPQENLLYARTVYSNGNNDSSEGRGRDSYSREKYSPPKSESNTDDEDDVCYFDNGTSNHMIGWKIHHLDVKTTFLNIDRKKLDSTLKEMGFLQCMQEKEIYRKVLKSHKERIAWRSSKTYAMKILKEAGIKYYNPALCPMEQGLKLSKEKDEPKVKATQYQKIMGFLPYLLHTPPGITYSVGVGNDMRLVRYSGHNVDIDDGRSTTKHPFYLGTSPITWCSQKQTIVALSSYEAEFMAATAVACQAIWLRK
nr:hypothetical protein [Tanacetum cinerariifolium]